VSAAIGSAPLRDGARLRLALSPAHLGDLRIELSMSGSRLRGTLFTESDAARDLILAHLDDLRRDLARRGLKVGRFEVVVARSGAPGAEAQPEGPRPRSHRRQVLDLEA
jgi:flagellar hook-length control protein FliK